MSEAARLAEVGDLGAIAALLDAFARAITDERGGATFLAAEATGLAPVGTMLGADDSVAIVGTYDGVVLGVATMQFVSLADGKRIGRIGRLVVDAEARKSGIGEAMMNLLLARCAERGCSAIESVALPGDRNTKNFFESFGLKARLLVVSRDLSA